MQSLAAETPELINKESAPCSRSSSRELTGQASRVWKDGLPDAPAPSGPFSAAACSDARSAEAGFQGSPAQRPTCFASTGHQPPATCAPAEPLLGIVTPSLQTRNGGRDGGQSLNSEPRDMQAGE